MIRNFVASRRVAIEAIARAVDAWRAARSAADAESRCPMGTPFTSAEDAATRDLDAAIAQLRGLQAAEDEA